MKQVIRKASKGQTSVPTLVSVLMLITVLTSLICLGYPSDSAYAVGFSEAPEVKLIASDGAASDRFGVAVAISGDTLVAGAYGDNIGNNTGQGSAYVFTRSGTNWMEQAKLTASDGAEGDILGISVAINGDTLVAGACGANSYQGSAYVFTRSGTDWVEQAKLTASDGDDHDYFGYSVAIDGDTVVVGSPFDTVGANNYSGSVYVFTWSGTNWTQQAHLTASDGAPHDSFGFSVAIDGDTAVVGACTDTVEPSPIDQGSAYVFARSGSNWTQQAHLTASDGAAIDGFGGSVAINGDTAVIGASGDDVGGNTDQGSAYVFTRSGTNWMEQAKLTASDGSGNDEFGISVAINGDTAVVGAYVDDVEGNIDQGSAYVFTRSGTNWMEQAKLTASDGAAEDDFGISAAIDGDTVVVGAFYDDFEAYGYILGPNQGSAYVYEEGIAQVSATVTLEPYLISVTITEGYPTAVEYGAMLSNTEAEPTAYIPGTYSYLRVENDGNVAADLLIRGANATCGTGTWILAATPGPDQYSHLYGLGQTPGSYSPLSTSTSVLGTNVTVGGTVDFNVKIQTPTDSTVYGQYSTTVTVVAVGAS